MAKTVLSLFAVLAIIATTGATRVNECGINGKALEDTESIQITNCDVPPCKLKKRTKVSIVQSFTPDHDVEKLITSVHATILGLPLPFIGVDGADACPKVFTSNGTAHGCPLKKGETYSYRNEFPILREYPTVNLVVYWALVEQYQLGLPDPKASITCFSVPAMISK